MLDPSASQGGINNLLKMQQDSLTGLIGNIGNAGKTSRTNTVNDLIARGGLEGLNEAQTQARILQEAGGSLTPEGQANVNQVLQTAGTQDKNKFTTSERLSGQDFTGGENVKKASAEALQNELKAKALYDSQQEANALKKLMQDESLSSQERRALAQNKVTERGQNITAEGQKLMVQGDDGMNYLVDKRTGGLTQLVKGQLPYNGKGSKEEVDAPTGYLKTFIDNSSGKDKVALNEMYKTGELNVMRVPKEDSDGKVYYEEKLVYKGQPTTSAQLKQYLGIK
jgi:hypothetical protein